MLKNLILDLTYVGSKFGPRNSSFKNLASSVTRYHGQLSSCTISEKTNDLILRKFGDGRTDILVDESDFTGRCPTNVEGPTTIESENTRNFKTHSPPIRVDVRNVGPLKGKIFHKNNNPRAT